MVPKVRSSECGALFHFPASVKFMGFACSFKGSCIPIWVAVGVNTWSVGALEGLPSGTDEDNLRLEVTPKYPKAQTLNPKPVAHNESIRIAVSSASRCRRTLHAWAWMSAPTSSRLP